MQHPARKIRSGALSGDTNGQQNIARKTLDGFRLTAREEDFQLVQAHNQGDKAAFQRLTQKYRLRVHNHCRHILSNKEESEDLTQEVFIKVLRSIRNFQPTDFFYTWVYRITVNCCLDHLKKTDAALRLLLFVISPSRLKPKKSGKSPMTDSTLKLTCPRLLYHLVC